ncbi:sulfatase-like hydrolase/transferase, partial [Rikenella microfusus]
MNRSLRPLLLTALLPSAVSAHPDDSPNIIYILADDMGYGDVSALNPECKVRTRHIDSLAAQGISFTDAHTSSSVSTPSRYSILTGRYNWRSSLQS